eukprot:9044502-Alexandrium_andersonii.AAC.1
MRRLKPPSLRSLGTAKQLGTEQTRHRQQFSVGSCHHHVVLNSAAVRKCSASVCPHYRHAR